MTALAKIEKNPLDILRERFDAKKYNVIAPVTHFASLPVGTRIAVTEVAINVTKEAKEVFPIAGSDVMLAKVSLDRIAAAAGVTWLEEKRVDDRKHPHYVEAFVRGKITDFDGTVREITGHKVVDLRADAGGDVPGKDYEEIVSKAQNAKDARGNPNPRDPSNQLMEARKFIAEVALSKAKNRAIASALGIKRAYSRAELAKPFIIPKLVPDANSPVAQQAILMGMVGGAHALYGAAQHNIVEAEFEDAPAPPNEQAPPTEEASPPVEDDGPPPVDDEDDAPLSDEEREALVNEAWQIAKRAGLANTGWNPLVKSALGAVKLKEANREQLALLKRAAEAFAANAGGDQ